MFPVTCLRTIRCCIFIFWMQRVKYLAYPSLNTIFETISDIKTKFFIYFLLVMYLDFSEYQWDDLSSVTVSLWHAVFCNVCILDRYQLSKLVWNRLQFQTGLQQQQPVSDPKVQCLQETNSLKQKVICYSLIYIVIFSTNFPSCIWNYQNFCIFWNHDSLFVDSMCIFITWSKKTEIVYQYMLLSTSCFLLWMISQPKTLLIWPA